MSLKITLEAARINAGLNQKSAAAALKISNKTLCKWENGKSFPDAKQIDAICALYGLEFDNINFYPPVRFKRDEEQERKGA